MIPVPTAFLALPIKAVLMPRKRCAGKDESEASLSIGDVSRHTVDPSVGASDKRQMIDKQMIDEDALARLTRPGGEEIIETLYGINPKTFEVETVSLNRGGELRKSGKDVEPRTHYVAHARDPKSEVRIAFGLTNVFSVPQALVEQESTKRRVEELRKKAAEMRAGKI
jgi:hypothetical protein